MTTSNPPGSKAGGERRQAVDFDLFGGDSGSKDPHTATQELDKIAGHVDFDVFGTGDAAAARGLEMPPAENVDFDIFGAEAGAGSAEPAVTVLPDNDMDADDATRLTAPATPAQAAEAAPHLRPTPAAGSAAGKLVALAIAMAVIAAVAWFFLR